MALVYSDRVKELSVSEGTADFIMGGAPTGHQTFSTAIGTGNTCYYCADDYAGNWEVGFGTYTSSTSTLTRTTIIASSNTGAKTSFGVGIKYVMVVQPSIEVGANAIHRDTANGKMYRIVVTNGSILLKEITAL